MRFCWFSRVDRLTFSECLGMFFSFAHESTMDMVLHTMWMLKSGHTSTGSDPWDWRFWCIWGQQDMKSWAICQFEQTSLGSGPWFGVGTVGVALKCIYISYLKAVWFQIIKEYVKTRINLSKIQIINDNIMETFQKCYCIVSGLS